MLQGDQAVAGAPPPERHRARRCLRTQVQRVHCHGLHGHGPRGYHQGSSVVIGTYLYFDKLKNLKFEQLIISRCQSGVFTCLTLAFVLKHPNSTFLSKLF